LEHLNTKSVCEEPTGVNSNSGIVLNPEQQTHFSQKMREIGHPLTNPLRALSVARALEHVSLLSNPAPEAYNEVLASASASWRISPPPD
jgi:hypothetical protein